MFQTKIFVLFICLHLHVIVGCLLHRSFSVAVYPVSFFTLCCAVTGKTIESVSHRNTSLKMALWTTVPTFQSTGRSDSRQLVRVLSSSHFVPKQTVHLELFAWCRISLSAGTFSSISPFGRVTRIVFTLFCVHSCARRRRGGTERDPIFLWHTFFMFFALEFSRCRVNSFLGCGLLVLRSNSSSSAARLICVTREAWMTRFCVFARLSRSDLMFPNCSRVCSFLAAISFPTLAHHVCQANTRTIVGFNYQIECAARCLVRHRLVDALTVRLLWNSSQFKHPQVSWFFDNDEDASLMTHCPFANHLQPVASYERELVPSWSSLFAFFQHLIA